MATESMRASDEDRARVQAVLNDAFSEGRVTKVEWERRATDLEKAVTWADLDGLIADLPASYPGPRYEPRPQIQPVQPVSDYRGDPVAAPQPGSLPLAQPPRNGLATAALVCGIGQFLVGFPLAFVAIFLGYRARRQIRATGEGGMRQAQAGITLGYVGLGLVIAVLVFFAARH